MNSFLGTSEAVVIPKGFVFGLFDFQVPSGSNLVRRWPRNSRGLARIDRSDASISMWKRQRAVWNADWKAEAKSFSS